MQENEVIRILQNQLNYSVKSISDIKIFILWACNILKNINKIKIYINRIILKNLNFL